MNLDKTFRAMKTPQQLNSGIERLRLKNGSSRGILSTEVE